MAAEKREGASWNIPSPTDRDKIKFKKKTPVHSKGVYIKIPLSQQNLPTPLPAIYNYRSLTEFEVQVVSYEPSFIIIHYYN